MKTHNLIDELEYWLKRDITLEHDGEIDVDDGNCTHFELESI